MNRKHFASRLTVFALLASLPLATGACGFIFSHAPPTFHEQMDNFTCTESDLGPFLDGIYGGVALLGALAYAIDPDLAVQDRDRVTIFGGGSPATSRDIAVLLSVGVLYGAAAAVGFNKSKKCRAAKRALAQRQSQGQGVHREPRTVDAVPVQAVVLRPAAYALTIGERVQLVATAQSSSGTIIANKMFGWSSSNDAVASVSNAGLVTAHTKGTVVIAATTDNVVGTANIVVAAR